MDKVDFFIMRTAPFTSLVHSFTYRCGIHKEAGNREKEGDWFSQAQRKYYI